jgi:hypothetical protein
MRRFELVKWVNAVLHNDEASTDEELIEYFRKGGLTQREAQKAVSQRSKCLSDASYEVVL